MKMKTEILNQKGFNEEWSREGDFAFTIIESKTLNFMYNMSLCHYKAGNLNRHRETNHKIFFSGYPTKSKITKKEER